MTSPGATTRDLAHDTADSITGTTERQVSRRSGTFASLAVRNFRLFAAGQVISMTGLWMQRIAQDWLILTLTHSATAVGLATAVQCLPTLLLGVVGGAVGDRYPRRRVLLVTQGAMAMLAGALAALTLTHAVAPWHVYVIAFALGLVSVVDNPARQSFVVEIVGPDRLRNAVGINSSVYQLGGFVGPAIAGLTINAVGVGFAFALNAVSYIAPILALSLLRESELQRLPTASSPLISEGPTLRDVVKQPQIFWPLVITAALGLFALNLPVTLAALTRDTLHAGPGCYGVLNAVVAVGSLLGALYSARQTSSRLRVLLLHAAILSFAYLVAAAAPDVISLSVALACVGAATLLLITGANAMVQLAAPRAIQGRVMGVYLVVILGSATAGGPVLGMLDQHFGARFGLLLAGVGLGLVVLGVACILARHEGVELRHPLVGLELRVRPTRRVPAHGTTHLIRRPQNVACSPPLTADVTDER